MGRLPVNLIAPSLLGLVFLVTSCVGRWRIFAYTGHKGILSLVPIVRLFVYGDIAGRRRSAAGIILAGLLLSVSFSVLGKISIMAATMPDVLFRASVVCFIFIGIFSVLMLIFYIRIVLGVCSALSLPKPLFTLLALFLFPFAEFIAGAAVFARTKDGYGESGQELPKPVFGKTASLEACLSEEDEAIRIWDSGSIIIRDGIVTNTSPDPSSMDPGEGGLSGG